MKKLQKSLSVLLRSFVNWPRGDGPCLHSQEVKILHLPILDNFVEKHSSRKNEFLFILLTPHHHLTCNGNKTWLRIDIVYNTANTYIFFDTNSNVKSLYGTLVLFYSSYSTFLGGMSNHSNIILYFDEKL